MYGWHWLPKDRKLCHRDGRLVVPGETLTVEGEPGLCVHGLHACTKVRTALVYAPGAIACRVRLSGRIVRCGTEAVATRRTCLWMLDASRVLQEYACWCAESVLRLAPQRYRPQCQIAIDTKRAQLAGKTVDAILEVLHKGLKPNTHPAVVAARRASHWGQDDYAARIAAGTTAWLAIEAVRATNEAWQCKGKWFELRKQLEEAQNAELERLLRAARRRQRKARAA